jgi:biotin carboxyl carrier protein
MKYDVILGKKTYAVEIEKTSETLYEVRVDGTLFEVDARNIGSSVWSMLIGHNARDIDVVSMNGTVQIAVDGDGYELEVIDELHKTLRNRKGAFKAEGPQEVKAPMPGKVVKVLVKPGDAVEEGQGLVIVEAMKMENVLKSAIKGVVKEVFVNEGQAVEARMPLATVDPAEAAGA